MIARPSRRWWNGILALQKSSVLSFEAIAKVMYPVDRERYGRSVVPSPPAEYPSCPVSLLFLSSVISVSIFDRVQVITMYQGSAEPWNKSIVFRVVSFHALHVALVNQPGSQLVVHLVQASAGPSHSWFELSIMIHSTPPARQASIAWMYLLGKTAARDPPRWTAIGGNKGKTRFLCRLRRSLSVTYKAVGHTQGGHCFASPAGDPIG